MRGEGRTEADTDSGTGTSEGIFELVVHEAKDDDEDVHKYIEAKYDFCSAAVDEPGVITLHEFGVLHLGGKSLALDGGGGAHQTLETPSLGLVALERGRRGSLDDDVWVCIEGVDSVTAVREIEAGGASTWT